MIENKLLLLLIGILLLISLLIAVFIYIIVQRMIETRSLAKVEQYIKKHNDKLYLYLIEGKVLSKDLIPHTRLDIRAIEEMLVRYTKNISGEDVLFRITAYMERYLQEHYRKQLKSSKWSIRINALYKISDFRLYFLVNDVFEMLNSQKKYSKQEYFQMYKVLATFESQNFISFLLHPKADFGEMEYKKLLYYLNQQQFETLIDQYESLPSILKNIIIDIVGMKNLVEFVPFLEKRLNDDSSETRIRALKSIDQIGLIREIDLYYHFLQSPYWEERMMVAKLLVHVPMSKSLPYLQDLLKDSSWWVRSRAAQSIHSNKRGKEILESIMATTNDRFVFDMVQEVIGKG
ncbi:HEAT repeat domain-containing protein [Domibacillus aminovorans]|uniref:HEAT repeat domain-containing protein n=1 Tax=Domibacillus aminovorans TaxID=29332 RepID=A0A177L4V1_9BACI|nr:HEAT repeat domain-containing protein [Domibacillus aminovorans]OAH60312.1 hypothetical protein AWH49_16995 [Domibacillus aminovorans]